MQVISICPLRTGSMLWQVKRGQWALMIACKATFTLAPGACTLANEQEHASDEDEYWNDDPARSLHAPSDMVPFKPRADVLLVGHAFAPRAEPARSVPVRLVVGEVDKSLEVFCDRMWTQDRKLVEGGRFVKMPLRWERAAGGPDTPNPIGVRTRDATPDAYGQIAIPNLQPTGVNIAEFGDAPDVINLGPIAPNWPPRTQKLGRHAQIWARARRPMEPVPQDLDPAFFNSAPADQQTEFIRDDERIVLQNLHAEHPRLVTNLPGIHPVAYVERSSGEGGVEQIALTADTLLIDTDRGTAMVTWRGRVDNPPESGRVLVGMEGPGERLSWADVEHLARQLGDFTDSATVDLPDLLSTGATPVHGRVPPVAKPNPRRPRVPNVPDFTRSSGSEPPPISARAPALRATAATAAASISPGVAGPVKMIPSSNPDDDDGDLAGETVATNVAPRVAAARSVLPFSPPQAGVASPAAAPVIRTPSSPPKARPSDLGATVIHDMPNLRKDASAPAWLVPNEHTAAEHGHASTVVTGAPAWLTADQAPGRAAPDAAPAGPLVAPPVIPVFVSPAPASPSPDFVRPAAASPDFVRPASPTAATDSPWAGGSALPRPPGRDALPSDPFGLGEASGPVVSAAAASNAAAGPSWQQDAAAGVGPAAPEVKRGLYSTDAVELLWFDPASVPRLRAFWEDLIVELGFDELDPKHDAPGKDPDESRDRHDVFGVLAEGVINDGPGLHRAMADAVNDRGRFTPPLVLTAGEITFPFDELEQLKATTSAIAPLIGSDPKLKVGVEAVNELLKSGSLMSSSGVVDRLTQQLRDVFRESGKASHAGYLEMHVERILLEQRRYQRRDLFGDTMIRALIAIPGAEASIPVYLPDALTKKLPMLVRLKARVIAELTTQQDQYEVHPHALRVVALGRVVPLDGRRRR